MYVPGTSSWSPDVNGASMAITCITLTYHAGKNMMIWGSHVGSGVSMDAGKT
jgi:predicted ATPase with chaperone activity